jgi:hypothetical protein
LNLPAKLQLFSDTAKPRKPCGENFLSLLSDELDELNMEKQKGGKAESRH